jgi:hypothetical protein
MFLSEKWMTKNQQIMFKIDWRQIISTPNTFPFKKSLVQPSMDLLALVVVSFNPVRNCCRI